MRASSYYQDPGRLHFKKYVQKLCICPPQIGHNLDSVRTEALWVVLDCLRNLLYSEATVERGPYTPIFLGNRELFVSHLFN